jgi:hypothetical protein
MTTSAPASRSATAHRAAFSRKNGSSVPATRYTYGTVRGITSGGRNPRRRTAGRPAAGDARDHQAIAEHRRWTRDLYRDLLAAGGHPDAERTADILLLLRDGLSVGFNLDDPATVRAAVLEALARVLG